MAKKIVQFPTKVRGTISWFSLYMELKLLENEDKGSWKNCDYTYLFNRLNEEVRELKKAIVDTKIPDSEIIRECADVANFAMMIADIARLEHYP